MSRSLLCLSLALAFGAVACGGGEPQADAGHPGDSGTVQDAGTTPDAGDDAGIVPDAGTDGGTAPTATIDLPDGGRMSSHDLLTVHFSQGMDRESLQVGGTLAANGSNALWSTTSETDDTLRLEPAPQWPLGSGLTLTVDAQNPGGAHASASATLTVSDPFAVQWTQLPQDPSTSGDATFAFACDLSGCTFRCALDGAALASCTSPVSFAGLADGAHTMHVEASRGGDTLLLTDTWTVDQTPPTLVSAVFDGYGTLALTFDEPVDATAAAELARYTLTPAKPSGMAVTSASASGAVVSLGLSRYQLPIDYALTASARDRAGNARNGITVNLAAADTGSRVAFTSKASGTGDLRNWAAVPGGSNPATGLQAADAICQAEATAAGMAGVFRAFLSDGQDDAACRMRNLSGKVGANCGLSAPPTVAEGPWLATDGLPLVRSLDELLRGGFLRPIGLGADAAPLPVGSLAWHATSTSAGSEGQALAGTCADWTTGATGTASSTQADPPKLPFRVTATSSCTATNHLLCFQVDPDGLPLNDRYRQIGKVAFVTSSTTQGAIQSGALGGIAAADAICQSRASTAGLAHPQNFVAWLSDSSADAYCRVLGANAKKGSSPACGLASAPATGPWVTTTGFPVAASLDALVSSGPAIPIFATELETFPANSFIWTGTQADGTYDGASPYPSCSNWTSTASGGTIGLSVDSAKWTALGAGTCSNQGTLLCLEK